jgi:hypothetical protein
MPLGQIKLLSESGGSELCAKAALLTVKILNFRRGEASKSQAGKVFQSPFCVTILLSWKQSRARKRQKGQKFAFDFSRG